MISGWSFKIFWNPWRSIFWYASTSDVIATISGEDLYLKMINIFQQYGFVSCESKGLIWDFVNIFASTKYL